MSSHDYNDDKLNMFIDNQLDIDETDFLHKALLEDSELRERVCQLKAVRELVRYAYENPPRSSYERRDKVTKLSYKWRGVAASIILAAGALLGWYTHDYSRSGTENVVTAASAFSFFANQAVTDFKERKIVLHISTDDIGAINAALDEADTLLASYRMADTPLRIDIITNKTGINLLRVGVSPYLDRIERMVTDNNVSLYACERSILKAEKKEGAKVVLMRETVINRTARDLIPERLKNGWVYFKV
jgi:intracellular sulfur oxidation DsrE/DsrF family protein